MQSISGNPVSTFFSRGYTSLFPQLLDSFGSRSSFAALTLRSLLSRLLLIISVWPSSSPSSALGRHRGCLCESRAMATRTCAIRGKILVLILPYKKRSGRKWLTAPSMNTLTERAMLCSLICLNVAAHMLEVSHQSQKIYRRFTQVVLITTNRGPMLVWCS